jgi:hypothetical protein
MEPYGLDAIVALNRLHYLKTGTFAGGQSSYDRSGGNNDFNQFLGTDARGDQILLDIPGPGTVYRLWFTGFAYEAEINFYFDSEPEPRNYKLRALFSGEEPRFPSPLVGIVGIKDFEGYYCYVPLPFRHSLRITTRGTAKPGVGFYYNIGYHTYPAGTNVVSWTGREDASAALSLWKLAHEGTNPYLEDEAINGKSDVHPYRETIVAMLDGPAVISCLRLDSNDRAFDDLWLQIFWDDEPDAAVDAPLRMFFAHGDHPEGGLSRSLVVGTDTGGRYYTYFPMPFRNRARIQIQNPTYRLVPVAFEIRKRPFNDDFSRVGYFRTRYNRHWPTSTSSIQILDAAGSGHLVGVVASLEGPDVLDHTSESWDRRCFRTNELCYLEGDEQIFIDGSSTPAIQGTGTEDFFNAAWYFSGGIFNTPVAGCTLNRKDHGHGRTSAYRLFLQDAVPFRTYIRMSLERGPENDVPVLAQTLAYYYFQPVVRMFGESGQMGPSLRSPRVPPSARISAVSRSAGKLDLFVVDEAGALVTAAWEPARAEWYMWGPISSVSANPGAWVDAVCRSEDKLDVFFTDLNGQVQTAAWPADGPGWQRSSVSSRLRPGSGGLPGIPAGAPVTAVIRRKDYIDIFVPDHFGHVHAAAWPEPHPAPGTEGAHWAGWWPTLLFSQPLNPAGGVSRSLDKLDLFATNDRGEIFNAAWQPSFSEWHVSRIEDRLAPGSLRPKVDRGATVTAVSRLPDHLDIFVIDTGGLVWTAAWEPGFTHWSGWWSLGIRGVSGKAANAVSRSGDGKTLDVFVTDESGAVHTASWRSDSGWQSWLLKDRMGGAELKPPVEGGTPVAVVSRQKDYLDIFVAGLDRRIWTAAWDPDFGGPWRPWKPIGY